jgi:hypothetical protein
MGDSAGVLDFELSQIEFTPISAENPDTNTSFSEANCEAFTDPTPRSGDQRGHFLRQRGILTPTALAVLPGMYPGCATWKLPYGRFSFFCGILLNV